MDDDGRLAGGGQGFGECDALVGSAGVGNREVVGVATQVAAEVFFQ